MANSPNLILPYIEAAQAQKHVTHNEAIRALDAIVQLGCLDRDLSAPPVSPADGARYLIAAGASGAWAGKDFNIAAYQDGAWMFYAPREGWLCWVSDESLALVFDGAAWRDYAAGRSPNNASCALRMLEEELSLSGPGVTSAIQIPNGSILFGVSARVTQAITGASSYKVGVSGELNKFGDSPGLALGSTNFGIIGPTAFYADTPVIVTANGAGFTGGKVRLAIQHLAVSPPLS